MASPLLLMDDNGTRLTAKTKPLFNAISRIPKRVLACDMFLWRVQAQGEQKLAAACCFGNRMRLGKGPMQIFRHEAARFQQLDVVIIETVHQVIGQCGCA